MSHHTRGLCGWTGDSRARAGGVAFISSYYTCYILYVWFVE